MAWNMVVDLRQTAKMFAEVLVRVKTTIDKEDVDIGFDVERS